jgi:hypothetical protein
MHGEADLLHVIPTLRRAGRFAGLLNGRQQDRHKNADDRNDDQQLDERKASLSPANGGIMRQHHGTDSLIEKKSQTGSPAAEGFIERGNR